MKTLCFDIDGTLCTLTGSDYDQAQPFKERIELVNHYYDQGDYIILYTARGTTSGIDWQPVTEKQLYDWGVKYHKLMMGKPHYDVYICDKAINADEFFWKLK